MKLARTVLLLLITLSLTVLQPLTLASGNSLPFSDISNSYAKDAILRMYEKKIMNGTSDSLFSPAKPITRAEFLVTMNRLLGLESVDSSIPAYRDVSSSAWFYAHVQASTELGLTAGRGNGLFAPHDPVTRQEAAVWILRILNETVDHAAADPGYQDDSAIAAWALPYVSLISDLGLMSGNAGRFYPTQSLTRQETAVILDRLLQNETWAVKLSSAAKPDIQIGWQFGQTDEQYKESVLQSNVNVLSPRWFFLNQDGSISDQSTPSLSAWAKQHGKQVWAMFGNRFSMENTHALLSSPEKRAAAISTIGNLAVKYGIQGINLDFENIAPADREAFTSFVSELAQKLHANQMILSVDVSPDLQTDWTEAFDYTALGKSADYIVLMGYDEHWTGGSSGSVASLPWVKNGLETLLQEVPASKVILALPLFVKDWTVSETGATLGSRDLTFSAQVQLMHKYALKPVWNSRLAQYTAEYKESGDKHLIWLEDSRSLSAKYSMAMEHQIAGFAYWHIGGETPEIWPALRNTAKYAAIKTYPSDE